MKKIFLTLFFLAAAAAAHSQTDARNSEPPKDVVVIDAVARTREVPAPYVEQIRRQILASFVRHNRQTVVDALRVPALSAGASVQPLTSTVAAESDLSAFIDARSRTAMTEAGARFLVAGSVTTYKFEHITLPNKKPGFRTTMTLLLAGYDMKLGREIPAGIFQLKGEAPIAEDADRAAVASLAGKLTYFIYDNFKFETIILQLASYDKKNRLKECFIHCGADHGICTGDLFDVYEEIPVGDVTTRQLVGRLRVNDVTDAHVSKCRVTKGEGEIDDAFRNGRPLIAVSSGKALFH